MKPRRISPLFASISRNSLSLRAAALLLAAGTSGSFASTLWWDGGASTVNSASDNATTTGQNWLSGGNWDNGTTSAPVASWASGDSAVFGGSAATQTITAGTLTVGNLTFGQGAAGTGATGTAYTVSGGTLTLANSTVTANTPTALNSVLAGSTGLATAGSSTLTLGGGNSYTGITAINSGTLKITPSSYVPYRYYKFTVSANNGDGYNQLGELHYYNNGVWTAANTGSAAPTNGASGSEQFWNNVNDNKGANASGFSKFGINTLPYSIMYDMGSAKVFNSYNWSSANDSTPARNPKRWTVSASNDNINWISLDDRSATDQPGPTNTYSWSSTNGTYATVTNAANDGSTNAFPIPGSGNLPTTSDVQIAAGATLDLNGTNQIIASLGNIGAGGGSVINSSTTKQLTLGLSGASGSTSFSGVISDSGSANAVSLQKTGAATQIFTGNNTYSGSTTLSAGLVQLGAGGKIGSGALTINGAGFDTNGQNQAVGILTGASGSVSNTAATDSTLTITVPASTAGNFAGTISSPSTGKLNLVVNSTAGGSASNVALSNAANTFKGTITVNGTGFLDGLDAHGMLGINTEGALGDPTNPIVLTNGGFICNMYNPAAGGGWPNHAVITFGANRTITVTGMGGGIRTGYSELCTVNSAISGDGAFSKVDGGSVTLGGTLSNSYTGGTVLGGGGKLVLAKTGGAVSIPGNISLSSSGGGNASGIVLGADDQIVDSSILTWTLTNAAGGGQGISYFRLNGHNETIAGLVSEGGLGNAVIENRGSGDTATYPTGTLTLNVTGTNSYTYNGIFRDVDGGTAGGAVALNKIGTGTQILSGTGTAGAAHSGATTVSDGVLEVDGLINNSPVTVTATGKLTGTGTLGKPATIQSGGILTPGVAGFGTLTALSTITIGNGGTLTGTGTLNGPAAIASGGIYSGTGTISGALSVQTGGTISPGDSGIGNLNTTGSVTLGGNAAFELSKSGSSRTCDTLSGFSSITYGGTLTVTYSGSAPALNDTYQLFIPGPGATFGGSFSSIVGLPTLAAGLQWETTGLIGSGQIKVVNSVSTPSFNPVAGGYIGAQSVTITSDSGSTIYYTTNGSTPTATSTSGASPLSGITIPADSNITVKAFARKAGQTDSPVATAIYHTVTTPKWNIDEDGSWSDQSRWLYSVSPNAVGASVDFTYPRTSSAVVTLDAGRTAGNLTFGNANAFDWRLDYTNDSVLTLATSSGTPSITTLDVPVAIVATLAGNQGLAKAGPGVLTLGGTNTYSGDTAINGGVISVSSFSPNGISSPLGTGSTVSFNGGTLSYTGPNVGGGGFNRDITLGAGGGTLDVSNASNGFWFTTGVISGAGQLTKTGASQLIMQSTNTFDGVFQINQAEVQIRSAGALGSTVGATVVKDGARLCMSGNFTVNENLELNGNGGGNGALQNNDSSVSTIAGNINLATNSSVGGGSGGIFTLSGTIGGSGSLTKLTANPVTISGATSNTYAGGTTLGGTGKLLLAKTGGTIAIPGNINLSSTSWNGNSSGVVLGGDEQIADSAIITWTNQAQDGGTQQDSFLRLNGHTETIGGLVSMGSGGDAVVENRGYSDTAAYGTGTLIIQTAGSSSYIYNGMIRDIDGGSGGGTVALTKTGTGTQTLSGGMSNTGTTTVNAGALQLDGSAAFPVTVATGGVLKGIGSTTGAVTINAGGTLAPGSDGGTTPPGSNIGTLKTGNTTILGTYAFEGNGSIADRLTVTGNLTITGSTLAINAITPLIESSYVLASYTGTLTGTFGTVTGLPSGVTLQYDTANKQILLLVQPVSGYASWATAKGLTTGTNDGLSQDPDNDGLTNLMEYYLDGNPLASGGSTLLTQTLDPTYLTLTFHRRDDANGDVATQVVQYGSALTGWTDVTIGAASSSADANGVVIDVAANGSDPDTINVHVPRSLAATGKLFGRLKVTK